MGKIKDMIEYTASSWLPSGGWGWGAPQSGGRANRESSILSTSCELPGPEM